MTDWQPIETAPRDGTVILIAREKDGRSEVEAATFVAEEIYQWVFLEGDGTLNAYMDDLTGPTHWAPRPAGPSA